MTLSPSRVALTLLAGADSSQKLSTPIASLSRRTLHRRTRPSTSASSKESSASSGRTALNQLSHPVDRAPRDLEPRHRSGIGFHDIGCTNQVLAFRMQGPERQQTAWFKGIA